MKLWRKSVDDAPSISEADREALGRALFAWKATGQVRWHRPAKAMDNEIVLEQLWERGGGFREWRLVETVYDD